MKYCPYCGKQLPEGEGCSCPGAQEEQKKKVSKLPLNKIKKWAIPMAVLLVVVIAVICMVSFQQTEIDLANYIEIEDVTGLNSKGTIQYHLKEGALMDTLLREETGEGIADENAEQVLAENWAKWEEIDKVIGCITVSADKETGLSNGDVVTVTASFENPDNVKIPYHFKDAVTQYTVSGLQEGKTLDPFAEGVFSLDFTGFTGAGEATFELLTEEEGYSYFHYDLSAHSDLSNGDTVSVSVSFDEAQLEEMGYFAPDVTEATYTVEGLTEYLTSTEDVTDAALEELRQILMDEMQAIVEENVDEYNILTQEPVILDTYFASTGDPTIICSHGWYGLDMQNAVVVLGHVTIENIGLMGYISDYWIAMIYPNCYIDDSGNLVYKDHIKGIYMDITSAEEFVPAFEEEFPEMNLLELN